MKGLLAISLCVGLSAVASAEINETADWQRRIDAVSAAGGGRVVVPAGTHVVASLELKSGVTLELSDGATLLASTNRADYLRIENNWKKLAVLYACGATNIAVVGSGRMDGRGDALGYSEEGPDRWRMIHFRDCTGVTVENVRIENSNYWTTFYERCRKVVLRGLTIRSQTNFNNDGIDLEVSDALVENCDIDTDDDAVCFKSHTPAFVNERVEVRNCRISSHCNCIKFGTATHGVFRDIDVHDCTLLTRGTPGRRDWTRWPGVDSYDWAISGIAIEMVDGGQLERVRVRNIDVKDGVMCPVFIRHGTRRAPAPSVPGGVSFLRDVLVENVRWTSDAAASAARLPISITGVPGHPVENVTLRNVSVPFVPAGEPGDEKRVLPENERAYPEAMMFGRYPVWGLYARHVRGLKLEAVDLRLVADGDPRPKKVFLDVERCVEVAGTEHSPYGVCAHLAGGEYAALDETCDMIALTGIGYVRADFNWNHCQGKPGGEWNFSQFDRVVAAAETRHLTVLPILFGIPGWAQPVWKHLDEWGDYVRRIVERYGDRMPVVEIWNEENLAGFWKAPPNPQQYVETLKVAYAAVKKANPSVRVALGGTAGVPHDYIRGVYEQGGAKFFDIMNIHPYSRPARPEGFVDRELDALRKMMAEFGDAQKPIWITEIGWPTQTRNVGDFGLVKAALKVARPEKTAWKVILAECDTNRNVQAERDYLSVLPPGSEVVSCSPTETNRRLAEGWADAVFYPKYESYPVETVPSVVKFVKEGGTLLDFGGMPMWAPFKEKEGKLKFWKTWDDRAALRIGIDASFLNDRSAPEVLSCFVTEEGQKAGVNFLPDGLKIARFQTSQYLKPGDRMVPLMAGRNPKNGKDVVGACVYLFDSDFKGRVAVSGLRVGINAENTELEQAQYLVRALALAFAEGVEAFFPYEFRAEERDQFDREYHFGITHSNFAPKPAWGAYKNFIACRPVGSKQTEGPWRDRKGHHFPQWTLPDGKAAGMLWTTGPAEERALSFDSDRIGFRNMEGRAIAPRKLGPRTWLVPFSGSPIYFTGGWIVRGKGLGDSVGP